MHIIRSLGLALTLALLGACAKNETAKTNTAADAKDAVAVVNGKPLSKRVYDLYLEQLGPQQAMQMTEEQKLDQFIDMHLAAQEAEKKGLTSDPKVQAQLDLGRVNTLVRATVEKYLADHPVAETELKPEYDAQAKTMPREYQPSHILVDDKATADSIVKDLQGGADFAKVAAKRSKDADSAKKGGQLDWMSQESMPSKEFGDAVAKLEKGQFTTTPVQTSHGWHIIQLNDSRSTQLPPFEDVKDQVKTFVQNKKLQSYIQELRKGAKIEKMRTASKS